MPSYTTSLGLILPNTGEFPSTWGTQVNSYLTQYLDSSVAGTQTISGSQTAVTLTVTNGSTLTQAGAAVTGSAQFQIINCTGNPAGLLTITAPASSRQYIVLNSTSTNQSVKIVGAGPTTGVTLVAGEKAHVAWNGSDFVKVANLGGDGSFGNLSYTGTLTGGTGVVNIGSGQFYKDASGDVGIGTSSPGAILHTVKTSAGAATVGAFLQNSDNTLNTEVRLAFAANTALLSSDRYGWIGYVNTGGTNGGALTFATTPGGTPATEQLRITSTGAITSANLADAVGYKGVPINEQSAAYTLVIGDQGKSIVHPITDNNARTFTIPANGTVAFPVGTAITFINMINTVTISITSDTMYLAGIGTTGSRTLAAYGMATAVKITSTSWIISGNGLT